MDSEGYLLVADSSNSAIRRVSMDGDVTTLIRKEDDSIKNPLGICVNGEDIYVSDYGANWIKKISEGKVVPVFNVENPSGILWMDIYSLFLQRQTRSTEEVNALQDLE
jgi:hypothetical protein